jgi:hypothetical protein
MMKMVWRAQAEYLKAVKDGDLETAAAALEKLEQFAALMRQGWAALALILLWLLQTTLKRWTDSDESSIGLQGELPWHFFHGTHPPAEIGLQVIGLFSLNLGDPRSFSAAA